MNSFLGSVETHYFQPKLLLIQKFLILIKNNLSYGTEP